MAVSAPINLELTLTGSDYSYVKLEWLEPLTDPTLVIGYSIEISEDGGYWISFVSNTNSKLTRFIDRSITNNIKRYYRVKAITSNEISAPSSAEFISVPALPKSPTNLTSTVNSANDLTLTWRYRSNSNTSHYAIRQTYGIHNTTTYLTQDPTLNIINLEPHNLYKYEVRVKSKYGYSAWSNILSTRTQRTPYAPAVSNKTEYIKGNSALTWTVPPLVKELFKLTIIIGNTGTIYGYSISNSIGSVSDSIIMPSFLFSDNINPTLTDFTLDGTTLTINANSSSWLSDLSDYYFRLYTGTTLLDTFNVSDSAQEFTRDANSSELKLTSYNGGFTIASYLNNSLSLYVYDIDPAITGNANIPDVIDYQIEGSYNNNNWHILEANATGTNYSTYHTDPLLVNVRIAARNSLGLGDYG